MIILVWHFLNSWCGYGGRGEDSVRKRLWLSKPFKRLLKLNSHVSGLSRSYQLKYMIQYKLFHVCWAETLLWRLATAVVNTPCTHSLMYFCNIRSTEISWNLNKCYSIFLCQIWKDRTINKSQIILCSWKRLEYYNSSWALSFV